MAMISFFRTPKSRKFDYSPVFYDERKEALKERERQIRQEMGLSDDDTQRVSVLKGQFRKQHQSKKTQKSGKDRNIRLATIIVILFLLSYYIIYL